MQVTNAPERIDLDVEQELNGENGQFHRRARIRFRRRGLQQFRPRVQRTETIRPDPGKEGLLALTKASGSIDAKAAVVGI